MKYLSLAVILLSFFSCRKKAQTTDTPILDSPAYRLFDGAILSNDLATVLTRDGNIVMVGYTNDENLLVLKLSQAGNQLFRKEIASNVDPNYTIGDVYSIAACSDGGYMLCGTAYKSGYEPDMCVIKLNESGDFQWIRTYGGSKEDYGRWIIPTRDGNCLLCGISYSYTTEPYDDIYLVKIKTNGDVLWDRAYNKHEQQTPFHLLETRDGGYLVTGTDEPTGSGRIGYLLKVDVSGNMLWESTSGPVTVSHWEWGYCSAECSNGDFIMCGEKSSKLLLVRISSSGATVWKNSYEVDSFSATPHSMKIKDGNCVITGGSSSGFGMMSRCFLLKVSEDGNQLWLKQFAGSESLSGATVLNSPNGEYLITGNRYQEPDKSKIFLTKADANGNYK